MKFNFKILLILVLISAFFLYPISHLMPRHVDSWIVISEADHLIKSKTTNFTEPFTNERLNYPPGTFLLISTIASITNIDLINLDYLLRIINFIILSLLFYILSKELFNNEKIAVTTTIFTTLLLTDITMLGPAYLVPLVYGSILFLLFVIFLLKEKWILLLLTFITLGLTHTNTIIFTLLGLFIYLLFNKKYWDKYWLMLVMGIIGLILLIITIPLYIINQNLFNLILFSMIPPFFNFNKLLTYIFIPFFTLGIYFILKKENRARKLLIPLILILALEILSYSILGKGVLIRYRRVMYYIFLLTPLFVSYGLYSIIRQIEALLSKFKKLRFIKKFNIILIISILILLPISISVNLEQRKTDLVYVDEEEHAFLINFGKLYPNEYLTANHLQSYVLPYYNLKPVQISPGHIGKVLYFDEVGKCFVLRDINCIDKFFQNHSEFKYLYTQTFVNSTNFTIFYREEDLIIYKYNPLNTSKN